MSGPDTRPDMICSLLTSRESNPVPDFPTPGLRVLPVWIVQTDGACL